jgi:hypothetical protein
VQQGIGGVDQAIADIFAELNQDLWLVTKDHHYVLEQWEKIRLECERRNEEIVKFGERLEDIEESRAALVAGELRQLVETLTATAFKSPTDIERLVEVEAFELNTVLIMNRQSHAELLAFMEKQHIIVAMDARMNWEVRQSAWRQLRHDRCVGEFHGDLSSKAFTNPPSRIDLFAEMKTAQALRHRTRLERVDELTRLKLPESEVVDLVVRGFHELNYAEDNAISDLHARLEKLRSERKVAAEDRREALRAELHLYGALEDEPDVEAHAAAIEQVVTDSMLDAFFRGAGGLKPELKELMNELRDPMLIYDKKLQPTIRRVQVLICGLELPKVLESQGKSGMRSNLTDMLERLKNATKGDVPTILPILMAQVNELLTVTGLDPLLLSNLGEAYEELVVIVQDANIQIGGHSEGKSMSGTEREGSKRSSGKARSSKAPSTIGGKRTTARPGSRAKSSAGGQSGGEQPEVNMLEVRTVQKRLMMLMRASDLEAEFQEDLRAILDSLRQKTRCNTAIDAVVEQESYGPLMARDSEYISIAESVVRFLELNTAHVHEVSVRLGAFYRDIAHILEQHVKNDEEIDVAAEDQLYELAEYFKEEDTAREEEVTHWSTKLQNAADENQLEEAYEAVLRLLDQIYESYYKYHASATAAAGQHPRAIQEEADAYMRKICVSLGLTGIVATLSEERKSALWFSVAGSEVRYGLKSAPQDLVKELMRTPDEDEDDGDQEEEHERLEPPVDVGATCAEEEDWEEDEKQEDKASPTGSTVDGAEAADADKEVANEGTDEVADSRPPSGDEENEEVEEEPATPWWSENFQPKSEEEVVALGEESPELAEAYFDERDAAFVKLSKNDIESFDDDKQVKRYKQVAASIQARRRELKSRQSQAEVDVRAALYEAPPPLDPDGTPMAMSVMLPAETMVSMVTALRQQLVAHSEQRGQGRNELGDQLCEERQTDYTEELEERLRLHWPRKGRVEVKIRQVREGQLIAHRQRAQRHGRVVREKNVTHQQEFEHRVSVLSERCHYYAAELKALEATLPAQESLAALQGQEGKCRKKVQVFREECNEAVEDLMHWTTAEPSKLYLLSASLLKATHLFGESAGGDYSEYEYQELQAQLARLNNEIGRSVQAREQEIEGLKSRQSAALAGEAQFMASFEHSLQELSLREAIGMKYGAPRRNAQERLRTEQTCDTNSADAVDVLLEQLESLCADTKGAVERGGGALMVSPPRSAVIRENLKALRRLLFRRAQYLEFLPKPGTVSWDIEVPPEALSRRQDASAMRKAVPTFVPTLAETMQIAVDAMEERCRAETRKLYEDEGKEGTLGPEGVPDALQEWLTKSRKAILGEEGYRDKSRRRLRAQVEQLELIIAKEPVPPNNAVLGAGAAIIEESSSRALFAAGSAIAAREKSFQARLDIWESAKTSHRGKLRPQIGRPDASKDLAALCSAESSRCREVMQAIAEVKRELVLGQVEHAKEFVARISEHTASALTLMDTLVLLDDLGHLPGDELVEKKRKSLKRLKKMQRALEQPDAEQEGADEERDVPGSYQKPDGRHCPKRTWIPLPVDQLRHLFEKHAVDVSPSFSKQSEQSAADDQDWIDVLCDEFGAAGPESIVTTAHRHVMRARDRNWDKFIQDLDMNFTRLELHFGGLQDEEHKWQSTWAGLTDALVRDNLASERG